MSTETVNETKQAPSKEAQVLILELLDSKPSSYIMDGPGIDDMDKIDSTPVISFPSLRKIRNTSRVKQVIKDDQGNETFIYKKIRYINGCPFIEVERQDKENYKPNHLADLLIFRNGSARATKEGDIGKFLYLEACEYNIDAPNRPDDAEGVFKVISTEVDAQAEENQIDLENEAMEVLLGLKRKVSEKEVKYNEDSLEFLCSVFKVPAFESGFKSEAWIALARIARSEPKRFLNSIANKRSLIEVDVFSAVQVTVVTIDEQRAFFTASSKLIMEFDKDLNEEQKGQALVDFMTNPKNKNYYDQLRLDLRNKKNSMVAPIT